MVQGRISFQMEGEKERRERGKEQVPRLSSGRFVDTSTQLSSWVLLVRTLSHGHIYVQRAQEIYSFFDGHWLSQNLFYSEGRGNRYLGTISSAYYTFQQLREQVLVNSWNTWGNWGSQCLNNLPVVIHLECAIATT